MKRFKAMLTSLLNNRNTLFFILISILSVKNIIVSLRTGIFVGRYGIERGGWIPLLILIVASFLLVVAYKKRKSMSSLVLICLLLIGYEMFYHILMLLREDVPRLDGLFWSMRYYGYVWSMLFYYVVIFIIVSVFCVMSIREIKNSGGSWKYLFVSVILLEALGYCNPVKVAIVDVLNRIEYGKFKMHLETNSPFPPKKLMSSFIHSVEGWHISDEFDYQVTEEEAKITKEYIEWRLSLDAVMHAVDGRIVPWEMFVEVESDGLLSGMQRNRYVLNDPLVRKNLMLVYGGFRRHYKKAAYYSFDWADIVFFSYLLESDYRNYFSDTGRQLIQHLIDTIEFYCRLPDEQKSDKIYHEIHRDYTETLDIVISIYRGDEN